MDALTLVATTTAAEVTLYLLEPTPPHAGEFIALELKDGKWTGTKELEAGDYGYILNLRGGAPSSRWSLSISREGKKALVRKGQLDGDGNGGRLGTISL